MNRTIIMALVLYVFTLPATQAQPESTASTDKEGAPTITVTKLDVNDTKLELSYEIKNDSEDDAWTLEGIGKSGASFTEFIDNDGQTLFLRRWFGVPMIGRGNAIDGRYVRLRAGENQTESISLSIPVRLFPGYVGGPGAQGLAKRIVIEIGYYSGDLPGMILGILEEEEKIIDKKPVVYPIYPTTIREWFGGLLVFNDKNETLRQRDEEILIPYTDQMLKGEQVLRLTVDDMYIPYKERNDLSIKRYPPDLKRCTRVKIQYQPSMLEYFFPYAGQQSLLSSTERKYLLSGNTIVVQDQKDLITFVNNIKNGVCTAGIVRERNTAQVVCYNDDEPLTSFPIYNDHSVVIDLEDRFTYDDGFPSLRTITPHIYPIDLRVKCAANLKNLWNRFRWYAKVVKPGLLRRRKKPYPAPKTWCDSMLRAYRVSKESDEYLMKPYQCPSSGHGRCHYAMNPNCKQDSPPDMVLLFETKDGWNQHGGPDLFTFDNHEPKGGCVLMNDGTVKFIRTKEELRRLRWK